MNSGRQTDGGMDSGRQTDGGMDSGRQQGCKGWVDGVVREGGGGGGCSVS